MSDYGADENPSIPAAQNLAFTMGFLPLEKTNVMQWTYPDDVTVRKLANKNGKSNVLFRFAPPPLPGPIPPDLDPVPAGDACTVCWGNGKPFGVGETPETVIVVIQNVEKEPGWLAGDGEPPNGTFELTQDGGAPCRFVFENDDFLIVLFYLAFAGAFAVQNKPIIIFSFFEVSAVCSTFYRNTITDKFTGGTATIFIPPIA